MTMDAADVARELAEPGARELLSTATLARVAYAGVDGSPRVVPVGFFWTGGEVVFCSATTSPKVAALEARPEVAVTIDSGDTPETARSLQLRGPASIEIVDGIPDEYVAASVKAMGPGVAEPFRELAAEMYPQMARIAMIPRWARFFDFGAGRLPEFLQALVDRFEGR